MPRRFILARTQIGGQDLCMGIPDLFGATVVGLATDSSGDDYTTSLTLKLASGDELLLEIRQSK